MTYAETLSRYLWIPIGANDDADVTLDPFGAARAAGGLSSTARDIARLGQLVVDRGGTAVPAAFVNDLLAGGDRHAWTTGDLASSFDAESYRSCWYKIPREPEVVVASGIHGQMVYVDVPRRIVVAKQSHWPTALNEEGFRDAGAVAGLIARAVAG